MKLSSDQRIALEAILKWADKEGGERYMTLGGYAGTGKTTLLKHIRNRITLRVVAPTGKASDVLRQKGFGDAMTVHGYMYQIEGEDEEGNILFSVKDEGARKCLLVVDEASMISENMFLDILSFHNGKILFVGDHGQLPPVGSSFSIMKNPHLTLEEVHRQSSDNPIIDLATRIRLGKDVTSGKEVNNGKGYTFNNKIDCRDSFRTAIETNFSKHQIITFSNYDRVRFNKTVRAEQEKPKGFVCGDRIIFLQNDKTQNVFNGKISYIEDYRSKRFGIEIKIDSGWVNVSRYSINSPKTIFDHEGNVAFDYGYAITCHKSQGSSFENVIVRVTEKNLKFMGDDARRWLYTAITRAENVCHLFIG